MIEARAVWMRAPNASARHAAIVQGASPIGSDGRAAKGEGN